MAVILFVKGMILRIEKCQMCKYVVTVIQWYFSYRMKGKPDVPSEFIANVLRRIQSITNDTFLYIIINEINFCALPKFNLHIKGSGIQS